MQQVIFLNKSSIVSSLRAESLDHNCSSIDLRDIVDLQSIHEIHDSIEVAWPSMKMKNNAMLYLGRTWYTNVNHHACIRFIWCPNGDACD